MIVRRKSHIGLIVPDYRGEHDGLDFYLQKETDHVVLGIIMSSRVGNVYVLAEHGARDMFLDAVENYDLLVNELSHEYKIYFNVSHFNIVFSNNNLGTFNYIGIDRILSEQNFFEEYLNDDQEKVEYVIKKYNLIEQECRLKRRLQI